MNEKEHCDICKNPHKNGEHEFVDTLNEKEKCGCACHGRKRGMEHDTVCCENLNGTLEWVEVKNLISKSLSDQREELKKELIAAIVKFKKKSNSTIKELELLEGRIINGKTMTEAIEISCNSRQNLVLDKVIKEFIES